MMESSLPLSNGESEVANVSSKFVPKNLSSDLDREVWGMPKYEQNDDDLANLTDEQYLAMVLGPQRIGLTPLVPITFFYVVIFITGVIGNVAVCLVIVKNKSMHTATNYYLFSLAISDLMILLLGLPNDLAIYWQQYPWILGELLCRLRSWVSEMTSYSSVLIIVAFSMERYLAICHPLYSHTMSGFKRAVRIIILVWFISMLSAIPYALFTRLNYVDRPLGSGHFLPQSAFCALLDNNIYPKNYPVYELSSFLFFIFPMCILVILYIRMGLRIRETSGIQRNLPRSSAAATACGNLQQQAAANLSSSNNSIAPNHLRLNIEAVIQSEQRQLNCVKKSVLRMLVQCSCVQHQHQHQLQDFEHRDQSPTNCILHPTSSNNSNSNCIQVESNTLCDACCTLIALQQQNQQQLHQRPDDTDSFTPRVRSDKRSITVLLAAVVLAFFLCWAPFHAQRLGYVYFKESKIFRTLNEYLYYISGFLYYLSATMNPILYNLMSLKYRHAFKQTLCGKKRRRPTHQGGGRPSQSGGGPTTRIREDQPHHQANNQRSYTFRSSSRTGGLSSETNLQTLASTASSHRSSGRRKMSSACALSEQSGQVSQMYCLSPGSFYQCSSSRSLGKRAQTRSDFREAMLLAQTACSDIQEEDSFSSNSGLQMKILALQTEECKEVSSPNIKSVASQTLHQEAADDVIIVCPNCATSFPPKQQENCQKCNFQGGEMPDENDDCDSGTGSVDGLEKMDQIVAVK